MSDVMLFGVLKMPYDLAMADELSRIQFYNRVQEAVTRLEEAERKVQAQQYVIDNLMLEYCPEEMTDEQRAEWARNQRPYLDEAVAGLGDL